MKQKRNLHIIATLILMTAALLLTACSVKNSSAVSFNNLNLNRSVATADFTEPAAVALNNSRKDSAGFITVAERKEKPASKASDNGNNVKAGDKKGAEQIPEKEKRLIAIDAGHQKKGNYAKEPIGPGASEKKAKVSSGTRGVASGVYEYKLNLTIAKLVEEELLDRGYAVYMIRETNDVNFSNKERADLANESGADLFIRIHADSVNDSDVRGASTLYPSKKNRYVSGLSKDSLRLSKALIDSICKSTGAKNRGAIPRDDMSGINWCEIPVSIIEMGFMSNPKEDRLMQTKDYQKKIAKGICDGIDEYFDSADDE